MTSSRRTGSDSAEKRKAKCRSMAFAAMVVTLVVAATYGRAVSFEFVLWDDDVNIVTNPHLRESLPDAIGYFWTHAYESLWIPLTYTSWAILASLAQLSKSDVANWSSDLIDPVFNAAWFHAANLVVHIVATLLVLGILRSMCGRSKVIACALGAAVFGLHPLQVESVAWATGMKDVLSGMLALGAVRAYLNYSGPTAKSLSLRRRRIWYGGASLLYLLALCAKPSTVIVPAIVFCIDVLWNKRNWKHTLIAMVPWTVFSVALVLATSTIQSGDDFGYTPWPMWARPLVALDALYWYLVKTLVPVGLCTEYGRSPHWLMKTPQFWFTWLFPIGVVIASVIYWHRRHGLAPVLAILIFVLALLPLLGIVPFVYQGISTVADRYAYLAITAWAFAVTAWITASDQAWRKGAVSVLLVMYALLSFHQAGFWQNTEVLYARTLEINPRSWLTLYDQGAIALRLNQLTLAEDLLRQSIAINPNYADTQSNLGAALANQGRTDDAFAVWRRTLELNPVHSAALPNLCNKLMNAGRFEEALGEALSAHQKKPGEVTRNLLASVYYKYGATLFNQKDYEPATTLLREAVVYKDSEKHRTAASMAHNDLGMALVDSDRNGAIESFKKALSYSPDNEWAAENLEAALKNKQPGKE